MWEFWFKGCKNEQYQQNVEKCLFMTLNLGCVLGSWHANKLASACPASWYHLCFSRGAQESLQRSVCSESNMTGWGSNGLNSDTCFNQDNTFSSTEENRETEAKRESALVLLSNTGEDEQFAFWTGK